MINKVIRKLYGNALILRNLPGQTRVPYLPIEQLHRLRDENTKKIVDYAFRTVPYYRSLLNENRFDSREIQTADDLSLLPVLDKDSIRNNPRAFVSQSRLGKNSIHFVTSGTTGKPLDIHHDVNSLLANIAFGEREKAVVKKLLAGSEYREVYFGYTTSTIQTVRAIYKEWTLSPVQHRHLFLSVLEPIQNSIDEINRFQPSVIVGYGSFVEILFRIMHARKIQFHLPKIVMYVADGMTPDGKLLIENTYGIPVLSRYNAVELFKIGYFCEERNGFHLHEDLCHLRTIDSNNETLKAGEKGEVVVSNLVNHGTVLLNYRLGDVATLSDEKCPCGRSFRILSELEGRVEDIVYLQDGKFVHPRAIWNVFKGRTEILQYQLIQYEMDRFELKLVCTDRESYNLIVNTIIKDLKTLVGTTVRMESGCYDELKRDGKFRPVVSYVKPSF